MTRKIIQIATVPSTDTEYSMLVALCDDGSLWARSIIPYRFNESKWVSIPEIPQGEVE